ncbi:hypothetical protein OHB44_27955 [Micromonospora sp. NBC_00821]|uniref:hypothetical protein n=1 Tax=Micromonospora sp. NBC_00821 TaxID=2975977 RepID=UPI002ED618BA|nr:hypothetical protein OHB44_27955 [Micromonospora sp. NBC_00821]
MLTHGLGTHLDGRWTASKVSCWVPRQNGKGGIIEALELAWLFMFGEELIVHSSHQHRTSARAYVRLERIIRGAKHLHRLVDQYRQANGEQQIELRDGRMLQYTTRSRTAIRGFSAGKLVLDEAQELSSEQMAAILPTVSAMPNWQVWFFGTPPDDPEAWSYGLRGDGEEGIPRLAHFDWGAALNPTRPADRERARDRDLWYACNPALGIRITEETVEDECKPSGLGDKFAIERLGAWLPRLEGGGVLDPTRWSAMVDTESRRSGPVALMLDVTPLRDHGTISLAGERADGLEHLQVVDYRAGVDWMVDRAVEWKQVLGDDLVAIVIDGKNGAAALLDGLREHGITVPEDPERPARGDVLVLDAVGMAAAVGQFIDVFRADPLRLRHLDQEPLNQAVKNVKSRPIGDAGQIAWGRKASEVDIGPVVGVTGARYGRRLWLALPDKTQVLTGSLMA